MKTSNPFKAGDMVDVVKFADPLKSHSRDTFRVIDIDRDHCVIQSETDPAFTFRHHSAFLALHTEEEEDDYIPMDFTCNIGDGYTRPLSGSDMENICIAHEVPTTGVSPYLKKAAPEEKVEEPDTLPESTEPYTRWIPKGNDVYYFIHASGEVMWRRHGVDTAYDRGVKAFGNCFKSEHAAQIALDAVRKELSNIHDYLRE